MPDAMTFKLDTFPCLDPASLADQLESRGINVSRWIGKANKLVLVGGRNHSYGWILLPRSTLNSLDLETFHSLTISLDVDTITLDKLIIVNAEAIYLDDPNNPSDNVPYFVELADVRFVAKHTSLSKSYNVTDQTGTILKGTTNAGVNWDWGTMLQDIWTNSLTALGAYPGYAGAFPTSSPQNFNFPGVNAWNAFNDILDIIGLEIVPNYDGTFKIVNLQANDQTNIDLAAQNQAVATDLTFNFYGNTFRLPAQIKVYFPTDNGAFNSEPSLDVLTPEDYWRYKSSYVATVDTSSITAQPTFPGTTATLWGGMIAQYDPATGIVLNSFPLQSEAEELAAAYVNSILFSDNYNRGSYYGIIKFTPCSTNAGVAFYDIGQGPRTEIISLRRDQKVSNDQPSFQSPAKDSLFPREENGVTSVVRPSPLFTRRVLGQIYADYSVVNGLLLFIPLNGQVGGGLLSWNQFGGVAQPAYDVWGFNLKAGEKAWFGWHSQIKQWILLEREHSIPKIVKPAITIPKGQVGQSDVFWGLLGSETDTGENITVGGLDGALTQGKKYLAFHNGHDWYAITPGSQPVLGKATVDIANGNLGIVSVFSGVQGNESAVGNTINAFNKFYGFIPKLSWVLCQDDGDGYYISSVIMGDHLPGKVVPNQSPGQVNAIFPGAKATVIIDVADSNWPTNVTTPTVQALVRYAPIIEGEEVMILWTGSIFTVAKGHFDGGILGKTQNAIAKGGASNGCLVCLNNTIPGPTLNANVNFILGSVAAQKFIWISRNWTGFYATAAEC